MTNEQDATRQATPASTGEPPRIDLRGGHLHVTEGSGLFLTNSHRARGYGFIPWSAVSEILEEAEHIDRWRVVHNFPPVHLGASPSGGGVDPVSDTPPRRSHWVTGDPLKGEIAVHCAEITAFLRAEEIRVIRQAWALHLASRPTGEVTP